MKTISMDYTEYKAELDSSYHNGYVQGCRRMVKVLTAFEKEDFSEAHCILMEDLENKGHQIFLDLAKGNADAQKWLMKEGLWVEEKNEK